MKKESNILIIVEGQKTEPRFFQRMAEVFDLGFEIYCFRTNIYTLYKRMKGYDCAVDIKDVLKEEHSEEESQRILSKKFAYTYLVFDCDLHHINKEDCRDIKEIAKENFKRLKEMSDYFTNETDPTIGKLYINYPMMESYRDCDGFFDRSYADRKAYLNQLNGYKKTVALRKLCRLHVDEYTKEQMESLILQNLYKWKWICFGRWIKPDYHEFAGDAFYSFLLEKEKSLCLHCGYLSVINTSLFLILDYFGNKNRFYDSLGESVNFD